MFGCDMNGANCDAALKSVRTVAVRFPLAAAAPIKDSKGNDIRLLAGRGVFGTAAK